MDKSQNSKMSEGKIASCDKMLKQKNLRIKEARSVKCQNIKFLKDFLIRTEFFYSYKK